MDLDDVAALLADEAGHAREQAGRVADLDPEAGELALACQSAHEDRGQHARVDVAARDDEAHFSSAEALGIGEEGGEARGPGTLDDEPLALGHHLDGALEHILADEEDLLDLPFDDRARERTRPLDRDPFGDRMAARGRRATFEGLVHGGIKCRLDAVDLDGRLERLGGDRRACDEPAAADRHHETVEPGCLRQELEGHGTLARDDREIVIGVNEDMALCLHERMGVIGGLAQIRTLEHHLGTQPARLLGLGEGGSNRHHDDGPNAEPAGVVGDPLRVIAGRDRDDAARALGIREREQLVEGTPVLEGAGILPVLELEDDLGAGDLAEAARRQCRRGHDRPRHCRGGPADVVDGDGHDCSIASSFAALHTPHPATLTRCRPPPQGGRRKLLPHATESPPPLRERVREGGIYDLGYPAIAARGSGGSHLGR